MQLVPEPEPEQGVKQLVVVHPRDLKRVKRNAAGRLGAEGSVDHDAEMLRQAVDRTRKGFVKNAAGMRKVFAAGRVLDDGSVNYGNPGGGDSLAEDAAQALRNMREQMERLRPPCELAADAAGGSTPRVTESVRKSILALEVEESPVSVVSSDEDSTIDEISLPPPPPGGPVSMSAAATAQEREQLLPSEGSSSSSTADDVARLAAPHAALQAALAEHARKLRSLKSTLKRTAAQRLQLLHRPQPAATALHYWLEHTRLCCDVYDALVRMDRAVDVHVSLDQEAATLVKLQSNIQDAFAALPQPSSGSDSDIPWGAERTSEAASHLPEAVPHVLRSRAPPFIRTPGPDEFSCALRARLPAGGAAVMAIGASPRSRTAKRPPPTEPYFVELVQSFLRHHLGLLRLGHEQTARASIGANHKGSSGLVTVLAKGFELSPAQRQTLSAELCQRTISTIGDDSVVDLERAVEAVDETWIDRLLGPPLGVKRMGYLLKRNKRGLWQPRWFVLRNDSATVGELSYYLRHTDTLPEIVQLVSLRGAGPEPEPEAEPSGHMTNGGPLGKLDLALAVNCYACGALHGERRRRDLRIVTGGRTWRLRARSAREAVAWAKDLDEIREPAKLRSQAQRQRHTPRSTRTSSSSVSALRQVQSDENSDRNLDDEDDVIKRFDGELDPQLSVALDNSDSVMTDALSACAQPAVAQQLHEPDQPADTVVKRVASARARHVELQQRRCQLECELLAQRPRRVASLLGRDMNIHMQRLVERQKTDMRDIGGSGRGAGQSAAGSKICEPGHSGGDRWRWHLSRYLRDDPALAGLPGGILLAEAEAEAETEANGMVMVLAAVDLLALRLDKGEPAAAALRAAFMLEAERLQAIPRHPRLCNFLQLCSSPRECVMVFDCGDDGLEGAADVTKSPSIFSLRQFMNAHGPRLAPTLSRTLFIDLLEAAAFLHERGLHHGQISAETVLVFPRRREDGSDSNFVAPPAAASVNTEAGGRRPSSIRSVSSSSLDIALCQEVGWVNTGGGIMEDPMLLTPRSSANSWSDASTGVSSCADGHNDQQALAQMPKILDERTANCLPTADQFSCRLICISLLSDNCCGGDIPAGSGTVVDDLWNLGALLHLMLAGSTVVLPDSENNLIPDNYGDVQDNGTSAADSTGHDLDEPQLDPSLPEGAADLVARLVRRDPAKRQSVTSLLEHSWIAEASQLPRASSQANFEEELRALNRDRKEARQAKLDRAKAMQADVPAQASQGDADMTQQQPQVGAEVDAALAPFLQASSDDGSQSPSDGSSDDGLSDEEQASSSSVDRQAANSLVPPASPSVWTEI